MTILQGEEDLGLSADIVDLHFLVRNLPPGVGLSVWGLGFGAWGLGFRVWG